MTTFKKREFIVLSSFLIFSIIIGYFFFWHGRILSKETTQYRTEKVHRGDVVQTVSANGTLNPVVLVNVGTQITGKVQKIYADFNDHVTSGQVLLELDSTLLKTEVAQSVALVNKAQANSALADANVQRSHSLYRNKFISKQEWDQLLQVQRSNAAELKLAQAKLAKDWANLDYATIRSPVSGVVVNRQVDVGQTVTASFQTPVLFLIAQDLSEMQIDSSFAEADIGSIIPGQLVTFSVDAFPNRSFSGVVKQIRLAPTIQQNVVTYNVVVSVENKEGVLLPGMTAYVNIKITEHKNALLVPNAALRFKPKHGEVKGYNKQLSSEMGTVYKLVDGILEPITCGLSISDNTYTEVTADRLKEGDNLVVGYIKENGGNSSFKVKVF
ncbi:MAG: efflux RND transporter periplasmic adaptor subunit [Coxiellaceae bacterium]|jgi:HlyD family secretion protein|nr:efflux RND transporter periplasmic adaptor subunit [Coxiellaceae bacterium]